MSDPKKKIALIADNGDSIESAYSDFDDRYHELLAVVSAITCISLAESVDSSGGELRKINAFGVLYGLSDLAEKMMKNDLHPAGANQKHVARGLIEKKGFDHA